MAVIVGDRGKANAIEVPTLMLEVLWIPTDAVMNAVFVVSAAQQDSKPALSTIVAIGPTIVMGPPMPIPKSTRPPSPGPSRSPDDSAPLQKVASNGSAARYGARRTAHLEGNRVAELLDDEEIEQRLDELGDWDREGDEIPTWFE